MPSFCERQRRVTSRNFHLNRYARIPSDSDGPVRNAEESCYTSGPLGLFGKQPQRNEVPGSFWTRNHLHLCGKGPLYERGPLLTAKSFSTVSRMELVVGQTVGHDLGQLPRLT